ncbi:MAG TPA: elongation factor G [Chitinispirillaceae bacterium]|nr:elongation factor G [Chitinispirillaceae bacterium]
MKKYQAGSIRNVCLLSHGGVGKTSLLEASCFTAKATSKQGKVDNGSSIFDSRSDEKERKMTISTHLGYCEWKDTKINFLDTPGFLDLLGEAKAALRVVETAVILVDAVHGVQVGTELVDSYLDGTKKARMIFVNGMDKENADFQKVMDQLKEYFGSGIAPLVIPVSSGLSFSGVIDLVTKEAYSYTREGNGIGNKIDIPKEMASQIDSLRHALMETVAETDEALMNSYFEKGELSDQEIRDGLSRGIVEGSIYPLLSGSATLNMGVDQLLTKIVNLCPPASSRTSVTVIEGDQQKEVSCAENGPAAAFVFKSISEEHLGEINLIRVFSGNIQSGMELNNVERGNHEKMGSMFFMRGKERTDISEMDCGDIGGVLKLKDTHTNNSLVDKSASFRFPATDLPEPLVSIAIDASKKGDEDKVSVGLAKLHEEDVSFTYKFHADIHQSILSAMGDVQLDIILENLRNRFKVEVVRKTPKISYRETVTKPVKYVEYTHKKQSGGAGQYARVFIDLEPLPRSTGYEFVDKIVGGVIDQSFRPSVDKGVRSKMDEGILAGYPIVDVRVSLVDGKTHPVDSKDIAFQIAGREVFKKAFESASPILLEPVVNLSVTVPEESTGDIMGDLSSRRGKIGGMNPNGKNQTITAKVPEAEIQNYSTTLRSLTQGRGFYTKSFSHYEPVPAELARKIIESSKKEEPVEV